MNQFLVMRCLNWYVYVCMYLCIHKVAIKETKKILNNIPRCNCYYYYGPCSFRVESPAFIWCTRTISSFLFYIQYSYHTKASITETGNGSSTVDHESVYHTKGGEEHIHCIHNVDGLHSPISRNNYQHPTLYSIYVLPDSKCS